LDDIEGHSQPLQLAILVTAGLLVSFLHFVCSMMVFTAFRVIFYNKWKSLMQI